MNFRSILKGAASLLAFALTTSGAWGQANDNCANATPIPNSTISGPCFNGNNAGATVEAFEGGAGPAGLGCWDTPPDQTVWYTFTPPATANYDFLITGGDTQLKILSGTCGNFTAVACNEDATAAFEAGAAAILTGGQTYYIQIDRYLTGTGPFCIDIDSSTVTTNPTATSNDCIFGAIDITNRINLIDPSINPFDCYTEDYNNTVDPVSQNNVNGNAVQCDGATNYLDRWFTFTVGPNTPNVWIDVYSDEDMVSALYSGTPTGNCGGSGAIAGLTYIDCSDGVVAGGPRDMGEGTTPFTARINCNTLPHGTYWYRTWEYGGGPAVGSSFNLCIESGIPVGITEDSCPDRATIGLTCGIPNTDVNEFHPNLSNAGTIGNANNTSTTEPQLPAGSATGQFQENCVNNWFVTLAYANNVINNTALYAFDINSEAPCVANPIIEFTNMEYGGIDGQAVQVQVMSTTCAGGTNAVMTGSTATPCLSLRPGSAVGVGGYYSLPNGRYYIVVDGQNGQLVKYDLRLRISHLGAGCTPSGDMVEQPIGLSGDRCGPGTVNLTASGCAGGTLNWYNDQFGGTPIGTGANFTTPSINVTRPFYVSCTVGSCESARTMVMAIIKSDPEVNVQDTSICNGGAVDLVAVPAQTGGNYLWSPGGSTNDTLNVAPTSTSNYIVEYTLDGCTGRDTATVTVTPGPTAIADDHTICVGETVTIAPTISPNTGTYAWTPGGATTPTITVSPTTTTTYTLRYTEGACEIILPNTVTVNQTPSVATTDTTICTGGTATLNSVVSPAGGNYLWTPGNATTPSITRTPIASVNYILTYTVNGCEGRDTSNVTVLPNPTVTSTDATVCPGATGTLVATGTPAGGTYTWNPTGTVNDTLMDAPANTTTYTVTYDVMGCQATGNGTITVEPAPTATVSGGGTICDNQTATINIALTGNAPWSITYTNGTTSTTVNGITASPYTFNTNQAGTYTVTSVSNDACTGTSSGSADVIINEDVVVTNVNTSCDISQTQYTVTFEISGGDPNTYTVSGGTGTISPTAPYIFTSTPIASGNPYAFIVSDGNSCNSVQVSGQINCNCVATAQLSGGGTICSGDSAVLETTLSGQAPFTYSYTDGTNTFNVNATTNPDTVWVSAAGTYNLTQMADNNCTGSASGSATVNVNQSPDFTMNSPTICNGETATVTATPTVAGGTYLWSSPASVAGQTGQSVQDTPSASTYYVVTYTLNGCSTTDSSLVTVNPVPGVTVADQTICEGTSATVTANIFPNGGTFLWTAPAAVAGQTTQSVTDTPASTTTYSVRYTLSGCEATASGTVTVSPTPVISLSPANATICEGESVTLSVQSTAPGGSYNWTPAGLGNNSSVTVSPTTTTTYTVEHVISGCTSNQESSTITVNPGVTANATNDGPACEGVDVQLSTNAEPGAIYSWTGPNGFTSAQQNPLLTNTNAGMTGTYFLTVTRNGCEANSSTLVEVASAPNISISPASPTICAGQEVTLTVNSTVTGGTFNWTPAGLPNASSVTVSPNNTTTYSVTQVLNGCSSNNANATVTVNPSPTAVPSNNSPVCEGDNVTLTANTVAGATYSWTGPGGYTSTQQNPTIFGVDPQDAGNYVLTVTAAGCPSIPEPTNVQITPLEDASIDPVADICENVAAITLTATQIGGTWQGPGITNQSNGTFDPAVAGPGTHTITHTVGQTCPNSETIDITVLDAPTITVNASPDVICNPGEVLFNATVNPTPSAMTWDYGDASQSNDLISSTHEYTSAGTYNVTVSATANGCVTTEIYNGMVTVNPTPTAAFGVLSANGRDVKFTNQSTGALTYEWIFPRDETSNEVDASHSFPDDALTYDVILVATSDQGCTDSVTQSVTLEEELLFYVPNAFTPNGDQNNNTFQPTMTSGFEIESYNLKIFNRWGEMLFETTDPQVGWDGTYQNMKSPTGVYQWVLIFTDVNTDRKYKYDGTMYLLR